MSKKKPNIGKLLGFTKKYRTKEEIDQEYSSHALQLGHKRRVLAQILQDAERMEGEIEGHLSELLRLNQEGMKLPVEARLPAPQPAAAKVPSQPEANQ